MNGYNFTERVRKVLALARDASTELQHEYVGTEHILLGLLREGEGVASTVLHNLDVKAKDVEHAVLRMVKRGSAIGVVDLPYTSRAKKVIELSMAAARELNHAYVGTEHILLGLIDEEQGIAAQVLGRYKIDGARAREQIVYILGPSNQRDDAPPAEPPRRSLRERLKAKIGRTSVGARAGFNFTGRLRRTLSEARGIAAELKHEYVGTEHILLSLIRESEVAVQPQGTAIQALNRCGVDIAALRQAVLSAVKAGKVTGAGRPDLPYTSRAKQSLELAFAEARMRGHAHVGTEHLLLGLLREEKGIAAKAMESQGLTLSGLRAAVEGIGGRATGEIETDGANLVVADPSVEVEAPSMTAFDVTFQDIGANNPTAMLLAALVTLLEKQPDTAKLFAEHGITADVLRELAKTLNDR